jgi:hypothetical protein
LAADISIDPHEAARQAVRFHHHGGAAIATFAESVHAELLQGVEEILDGALAHARHPVQPESPVSEADHGREEAHSCPRVGHEQIRRPGRDKRLVGTGADEDCRFGPFGHHTEP